MNVIGNLEAEALKPSLPDAVRGFTNGPPTKSM